MRGMIGKAYSASKRLLIDIWALNMVLVRSQMEIRKMLLDAGGERILLVFLVTENVTEFCSAVL